MLADRVRMGRNKGEIEYIGEVYLAQDNDFVKVSNRWVYRGSELEIEIPHIIQGEKVTSYDYMFYGTGDYLATPVTRVDSNNKRVTNMSYMFYNSSATTLDLSSFDTSNVTGMEYMYAYCSMTEYINDRLTAVGAFGFAYCTSLDSINLPEVTTIGNRAFTSCSTLKRVEFPKLTTLMHADNFTYCHSLTYADLGLVTNLPSWSLSNCNNLETVILRKSDGICTLASTNALSSSKFINGTAFVYVPAELVDTYKSATNWSTYAGQIRAIEDYPEITGGATI